MTALDVGVDFGLELIGKQALSLIRQHLDDEIGAEETRWNVLDAQLGYDLVVIERVLEQDYYHGHTPSLIEAPPERYPNVSVMAWQAQAQAELLDELGRYNVSLFVEVMCKSEFDEAEVNSRTQRTTNAVHACLMHDKTLGGVVLGIRDTPNVLLTDVFVRPEVSGHGDRFFWQGARLEYTVEKFSSWM